MIFVFIFLECFLVGTLPLLKVSFFHPRLFLMESILINPTNCLYLDPPRFYYLLHVTRPAPR
ncbi:unnamed protein product [Meloidogyne enterolobii]|uniref:Uncharacterized protein n=1 Tax=Meloidogyne enterolobii TaxID=390850 RepID=A0ACB0ZES8_MELEN